MGTEAKAQWRKQPKPKIPKRKTVTRKKVLQTTRLFTALEVVVDGVALNILIEAGARGNQCGFSYAPSS
jgi:hypothetical protein